jgi:hypothetical protein
MNPPERRLVLTHALSSEIRTLVVSIGHRHNPGTWDIPEPARQLAPTNCDNEISTRSHPSLEDQLAQSSLQSEKAGTG